MKSNRRYPPTGDAILADTGGLWPPLGAPKQCLKMLSYLSAFADSALGFFVGGCGCWFVVGFGCSVWFFVVGVLCCLCFLVSVLGVVSASFWDEEFRGLRVVLRCFGC